MACFPRQQTPISQANPIAPIQPPIYELVAGQTAIETFNPPGAGAAIDLTIATQVLNPNAFGIRLKQVQYTIFLDNRNIETGIIDLDQFILGNAQVPLKFPLSVSLEGKLELIKAAARAFTGTALPFRIEGKTVFTSQSYEFESRDGVIVQGETLAREAVQTPILRLADDASDVLIGIPAGGT